MNDADFAEAVGFLRAAEKRIMPRAAIDRVIDASNLAETLSALSQYFDFADGNYERALSAELKSVYDVVYELSPNRDVVDALSAKYDFHNVKAALKARLLGVENAPYVYVTDVEPKDIASFVFNGAAGGLPEYIEGAVTAAKAEFEASNDPQAIDITLDRLMFERMLELCERIGSGFIENYVKAQIDFYNIKTLIRAKNMNKGMAFAEAALVNGGFTDVDLVAAQYGKTAEGAAEALRYGALGEAARIAAESGLPALEKAADNFLIDALKEARYVPYGPEPVFAYIAAKENEIRQARIILTCKANGVSSDVLRERLRDNYA